MLIAGLILVGVGVLLILLGAFMTYRDWKQKKFSAEARAREESLDKTLTALAKVLEALKDYPAGQRLIVFGIVLIILGGIFCGVSGFTAA